MTWVKLVDITLHKVRHKRLHYYMIPLFPEFSRMGNSGVFQIENFQNGQSHRDRKLNSGSQGLWGGGNGKLLLMDTGC